MADNNVAKLGPQGRQPVRAFTEMGAVGWSAFSGLLQTYERSGLLSYDARYRTASDVLVNCTLVAAGLRYFLDLIAKPVWQVEPAEDLGEGESSRAAQDAAELLESAMYDLQVSWTRVVRRSALYLFHGFSFQEWTAKRRRDGKIGYLTIEGRPQHTIVRWDADETGTIRGVWQRSPQTGQELYLPRAKTLYLVDDALTDSPDGLGLWRHLVDPSRRLDRYKHLEEVGFERDLRGIPVGRAPLSALAQAVDNSELTQEQADNAVRALRDFVSMRAKTNTTGLILDSKPHDVPTADGFSATSTPMWDAELLQAQGGAFADLARSVDRESWAIAVLMGVENLLVGSGDAGSRALSEDKSRNMWLRINATLGGIAEGVERDLVPPLMTLNGVPEDAWPSLKPEDVAFRDVQQVASVLRDMATAGAVLDPTDPVVDDVRDLLGVSRPPQDPALRGAPASPTPTTGDTIPGGEPDPASTRS
jgi:hypothetical protein